MAQHNPLDSRHMKRLNQAAEHSRLKLQAFREHRLEALKEFVGVHYSESGADDKVPVNLIELAHNVYTRQIAGGTSKSLISTPHQSLKSEALDFEADHNHLLKEINFGQTKQDWVSEAMFLDSHMKVGITEGAQGEINGFLHDAGQAFADIIDADDWVQDMNAKRYEQIQYAGNRYFFPYQQFMESSSFKSRTKDGKIKATIRKQINETGDPRASSLSAGRAETVDEFREMVELWDFWLPLEQVVVTFVASPSGGFAYYDPVRTVDWDGGERGPYHRLAFTRVPGNPIGLSPMAVMKDLHDLVNMLFRKLARQAQRQKTIGLVGPGGDKDAGRIIDANDGDYIRADNPQASRESSLGGPDATVSAFFLAAKDLAFSIPGGNLELLGGLSPQSDTLGQDQILSAQASKRLESMQETTAIAEQGVHEALGDYLWYDPLRDSKISRRIPGTNIDAPIRFAPEIREGDFLDYNFEQVPYSAATRTPAQRLQTVMNYTERIMLPLLPEMREQGLTVDVESLTRLTAKLSNTPELLDVVVSANGPLDSERGVTGSTDDRPRQAPITTRNYVRKSVPSGGTRAGRDSTLAQVLIGGSKPPVQSAQTDQLGRGAG